MQRGQIRHQAHTFYIPEPKFQKWWLVNLSSIHYSAEVQQSFCIIWEEIAFVPPAAYAYL